MDIDVKVLLLLVHIFLFVDIFLVDSIADTGSHQANVVHGRYTRDITNFHLVVPQKVHPDGSFRSHHLPHYFKASVRKKRTLEGEMVHYVLRLDGQPHLLELEPYAGVTAPGMVLEHRAQGSHLPGTTFHQPRRHLCHFRGRVHGLSGSRVALSSCSGLVGYIRTQNGTFFVEPLHGASPAEGEEHVHVVYKRSTRLSGNSCSVKGDDWWSEWCARLHSALDTKTPHKRSEAGVSVQHWYQVMVVADKKFLMFHRDHDVEEYIICIFNIVSDLYHDHSVGNLIDIVIVRIVYLEKEEQEIDLSINADGEDTLESFCKWQYNINFKDANHPNHHDVGVLLTRYDICSDDDDTCGLLGLANLGTACNPQLSCCINEDSGLMLGVTTTHELGHTLGCNHDSPEESGCGAVAPAGDSTVMNPSVQAQTSAWSPCSRAYITGLFDSQMGECMLNEPKDHAYPLDEMPPGAFYDADQQCVFTFGPTYVHYNLGGNKFCETLWCKARDGDSCTSLNNPPADGTKCGPDKWCYNKECVEIGERPKAVNGEWGTWGPWSECSRTCGSGVSKRERHCDNPPPSNKGRYCAGKRHVYNICNTKECDPKSITFREAQCAEFNDKPYQGLLHSWKAYPSPDSDPNPCALYCLNEAYTFTKLAPRVKDGTRCRPGTRDTCVQGSCLPVGCDWELNSDAVEDVCGVCNGDGTHCQLVEGIFKDTPQKGYVPIVTAPVGAVNVYLEEMKPSDNMVAVSAIDNETFYLNGDYTESSPGEYTFGGVRGAYSKPQMNMDELHIKGPLTEPLVLYVCLFTGTNLGVRYSFAIPSEKPLYSPKYHWEFVEWGPCSAQCGGGTQIMKAACVEERDGKVKDSFCASLQREEPRARTCNDQPCRTRWKVWKWGACSGCVFQSGTRTRQVECVKQNPTNTGDEEIIAEPSECCGEPPKKSELCNSPRPCPKNMTSKIVKRTPIVVPIEMLIAKRSDEGNSFSDINNASTKPAVIQDRVHKDSIHLQEVLLEDSPLNLTEQGFMQLGNEVPDKVLGCSVQDLSGKAALERMEEIMHGPGYHKNNTKIHPEHKDKHKQKLHSPVKDEFKGTTSSPP